jgi:DeoR/GlpR family transcriptional regulator of sugar metabolism
VWLHDTVRADVAELVESGLVQRVQDRADLPVDRHELRSSNRSSNERTC